MNNKKSFSDLASAAIHAAQGSLPEQAHVVPVFASSTFVFDSAQQGMDRFTGKEPGYTYSRFGNPTASIAEELIASLERFGLVQADGSPLPVKALLHASGQSAMATLFLSNTKPGDTVLTHPSLYGGTHEFLFDFLSEWGVKTLSADLHDLSYIEALLRTDRSIRMIHVETPANPTMRCVDLEAITRLAAASEVKVSVDNTFATPYLQQPFKYGVDFVFHSTTKFLNGHGTAIGGILLGKDIELMRKKIYPTYKLLGACPSAFDSFLLIQGIKTLAVRMEQHCHNALKIAEFLASHAGVHSVHYNGLPSHPDYTITVKQMRHAGAVMSFELAGGFDAAKQFIDHLKMCVRAVSVGTVDTLISHPASMSHAGVSKSQREKAGISDGLIRMSVGLEHIGDILADLEQALAV